MENNINVLLFLSHEQQPPPDIEMGKLAGICKKEKETFFATTRNISALSRGAEVAFYAAVKGHYFVLATAKFIRFISDDDKDYISILSRHELYKAHSNRPNRMVGLVQLVDFDHFPSGKPLEYLDAWLDNGRALKEETILAQGPDSSVYYIKAPGDPGISKDEQIRLYEANKQEGRTKIMADRQSGEMEIDIHYELDGNIKGFGDRFWKAMSAKHEGIKKLLKSSVNKVIAIKYCDRYLFTPLSVALLLEVVVGIRGYVGQDRWANPICRVITTRPTNESRVSGTLYAYWPDSDVRDRVLVGAFKYLGMEAKTEVLDKRDAKHARILEVVFSDGWSLTVRFDKGVSYWRVPGRSAGRRVNVSFDFGDGRAEELASQIKRVAELSVPVEGDIYPTEIFVKARSGNTGRA